MESLIKTYYESGSATRRADGINVKFKPNNTLEMKFISGLQCKSTMRSPIESQLSQTKGDDLPEDEDEK